MIRRFVHLIVHHTGAGGGYTLRNIDTKPLFAGVAGSSKTIGASRLPRPAAFFESTTSKDHGNCTEFFLLGSKIVSVNIDRHTLLYDTLTSGICAGPDMGHGKFTDQPAWAAVQGKLYLANTVPDDYGRLCFEALRFDDELEDWWWDLIPSPPFFDDGFDENLERNLLPSQPYFPELPPCFDEAYGSDHDEAIRCYAAGDEVKGSYGYRHWTKALSPLMLLLTHGAEKVAGRCPLKAACNIYLSLVCILDSPGNRATCARLSW
jgi:hypothetical protein